MVAVGVVVVVVGVVGFDEEVDVIGFNVVVPSIPINNGIYENSNF